jgi:hypothetical protein
MVEPLGHVVASKFGDGFLINTTAKHDLHAQEPLAKTCVFMQLLRSYLVHSAPISFLTHPLTFFPQRLAS